MAAGDLITENWEVEYDGILFGSPSGKEIVTVDIFSSPNLRTNDTDRPQRDGQIPGDDYYTTRTFTMSIEVWGSDEAEHASRVQELQAATAKKDDNLPLVMRVPGWADDLRILARPMNRSNVLTIETAVGYVSKWSIQWRANDPRIYDKTQASVVLSLEAAVTPGASFDASFDLSFGGGFVTGTGVAENTGGYSAHPIIEITGGCVNPRLVATLPSGEVKELLLVTTVAIGQTMTLDEDARTIELEGVTRYATLDDPSGWFELPPGETNLVFSATTDLGGTPTITVLWYNANV